MSELVYKKSAYPPLKRLPSALNLEIGKIITRHAYLENQLNIIIYKLMGVDPSTGRISVREPSTKDRVDIINDLAEIRELYALNQTNLDEIYRKIESISIKRNQVTHGLWVKEKNGEIFLQITNSSRKLIPKSNHKTKRKITPELIPFGVKECRSLIKEINALIKQVEFLENEISDLLQSSTETHLQRNLGMSRSRGRNPARL